MPRFGDQLETLLKRQDERIQQMQTEIEQTRRAANLRLPAMPPYSPVWQSGDAKTLVRELNQFGEREEVYKSMVGTGTKQAVLESPRIANPMWTSKSVLHLLQAVKGTISNVADNTLTPITWDTTLTTNRGSAFLLDPADPSKIRFGWQGWSFAVNGSMGWELDTDGYRLCQLEFFDVNDVSLGALPISVLPPVQTAGTGSPIVDTFVDVPEINYFKVSVSQTSGGALDLIYIRLGFFLV